MTKQYNLKVSVQTAKPRSKRLRLSGGTARSEVSSAGIYESGLDLSRYLEKELFDDLFEKIQVNGQWVIRAKYGLYSNQFISALGLVQGDLGGGSGTGGSLFGLMRSWPSVDPGPSTQEALGANLGWELRNRIAALETAGYATQNWVLNKNYLTAHQDISHLLSKTEAASLYQPKGNYLTAHQDISHLLNKNEGMYFLKNSQDAYIGARFYNADLARVAAAKYIEFWQSGYGWFNLQAGKFITHGGTSAQFVKGDGSLDGNNYALASALGNYYTKTEVNTKLTDGSVTRVGTATVGSSNWPIYLNNGVPYACAWKFGNYNGAAAVNNGTLNENLNADMLDGHHKNEFNAVARFGTTATPTSGYYKVKIKSTAAWMLGFKILAYQNYCFDEINISGYNYGNSHWHLPSATLVNSQGNNKKSSIAVTFGYDSAWNLWVAIPAGYYAGISVTDVVNGYYQVADPHSLFEIVYEDTLTGTVQGTHTATCHALLTDNVASASRLQTTGTYTAWGQTYFANGVPQSVSGNMTGVGIIKFSAGNEIAFANSRFCFGTTNQAGAQGVNVGSLLVSNAWADYTKVPVNGIYIKGALRIGDITIEEDKANGGLKISGGVYTTKYVSALGLATGNLSGGSSGGGTAYDRLDAWADYTTDKAGYVLSAGLGADLNSRVGANATSINSILSRLNSLEGGGTTSVTVTGTGNAITDISKGGTAIIATKGATFLTAHQSLDYIKVKDIRGTAPKPNGYESNRVTAWFNNSDKPVSGLSEWYSGINVVGWSSLNYASWQLAATATTHLSDNNLYFRVGVGASWEAWQKILTSANYASVLGSVYQAKGDYVTVATTQEVTGAKTFSGGLLMPYSAGTWISMAKRANQILGSVPNAGSSAHSLFTLLNSTGAAISYGGLGVSIGFYGFYKSRMDSGENSYDWATTWNLNTGRLTHSGDLVAHSFIKSGGTSTQFLKADGSVDSNSYALASALGNYQPKGSYFTNQGHLTNKDFDTIVNSGAGYIDATSTNKPPTVSYGQLLTLHGSGDTIAQMAFDYSDSGNVWVRSGNPTNIGGTGSWKPWVQMLTATNYSATLDSRYVNKAGDTMTGALSLPRLNIVGTAASSAYLTADSTTNAFMNVGGKSLMVWDGTSTSVRSGSSMAGQVSLGIPACRWTNVYATTINVTSTGLVSNLNADMLDGKHYSQMASGGHARYTPAGPAAGRWIRIARSIASSGFSIYNAYAIISLTNEFYNNPTQGITFAVYIGYRSGETCTITQLGGYGGSLWPKVRIVYPTATNTAYYIEVYYATTSIQNQIGVEMTGSFNMELYDSYTAGEIPTGYAAKEQPLTVGMSAERFTSSVGTGTAPLSVASTTLVSNLNADMLDGLHNGEVTAKSLAARRTTLIGATVATAKTNLLNTIKGAVFGNVAIVGADCIANWSNDTHTVAASSEYSVLNVTPQYDGVSYGQYLLFHFGAHNPKLVGRNNGAWTAMKTFAFLDDNVASATKLQTARTIWGQSFDGTANVSGNLIDVGSIAAAGTIACGVLELSEASPWIDFHFNKSTADFTSRIIERASGQLSINNTLFATYSGNVGIRTTAPAYTLDVNGTGRFTSDLTALTVYSSNWFRSTGNSGWYSQTYGGGIYMTDVNWVRVYNNKAFRVQEGYGIGANSFIVGLKLHGASHEALEVSAGNYSMGLGCHNNGSWYWWRGTANPESASSKSYVMQYDGSVWKFTGQLRCDSLRIGDAIFTYDSVRNGIKLDKGLYSEGYLSALGLSELTNTKFTISAGYESDALTILGGGITRSGYSGDVWNKGYGALNVAIDTSAGDSKQTPLLLAFSAGTTDVGVASSRLFALELLNNGNTLDFKLAGEVKLSINKIGLSAWSATLNHINATSIETATVTASGKITCQSLTQTSDMRLKNVVRPMDLSVEAIAKAPSFIHQWKRDGTFDLGSSAQYWKEVSPLFTPRDKDGFLTMQYGKAALLSTIAIARRTVSHEERIRTLESENKKLRAELNGLKARLRA